MFWNHHLDKNHEPIIAELGDADPDYSIMWSKFRGLSKSLITSAISVLVKQRSSDNRIWRYIIKYSGTLSPHQLNSYG